MMAKSYQNSLSVDNRLQAHTDIIDLLDNKKAQAKLNDELACTVYSLPTTLRKPTLVLAAGVLIWHMYAPWSESCTSLMWNKMRPLYVILTLLKHPHKQLPDVQLPCAATLVRDTDAWVAGDHMVLYS